MDLLLTEWLALTHGQQSYKKMRACRMYREKTMKVLSCLLMSVTVSKAAAGIAFLGELAMDGMSMVETLKFVTDVGITPVLLVLFVWFTISRAKNDDNKVKEAYEKAQETMEANNKAVREREDYLMAESAKREEIIRQESERREKLIRHEAEKRESILMASQDRMLGTLDSIAESLNKMESALSKLEISFSKTENRLDAIERKVGNGCNQGNRS